MNIDMILLILFLVLAVYNCVHVEVRDLHLLDDITCYRSNNISYLHKLIKALKAPLMLQVTALNIACIAKNEYLP